MSRGEEDQGKMPGEGDEREEDDPGCEMTGASRHRKPATTPGCTTNQAVSTPTAEVRPQKLSTPVRKYSDVFQADFASGVS